MPAAETPPAVDSQLSTLNPGAIMAFTFEKLIVYQKAIAFTDEICGTSKGFRVVKTMFSAFSAKFKHFYRPIPMFIPRGNQCRRSSAGLGHGVQNGHALPAYDLMQGFIGTG